MNKSTIIFVFVISVALSIVHGEQEPGFTKEGILELDEILVRMDIMKPDEDRINKDVKTLIEEALHDLKVHVENSSDPDGLELCMITIKALEDELKRIDESDNGNQDTTTASCDSSTTTNAIPTTTSATPTTTSDFTTSASPSVTPTTATIISTTTTHTPATTSDTLNFSD